MIRGLDLRDYIHPDCQPANPETKYVGTSRHRRDDERCLGLSWRLQTTPERIWWQTFAMMESRKEEPTKCRHRYWIWIRIIYTLHLYNVFPLSLSLSLSDETLLFKRIRETWELRFAGCEPVRSVFALQVFHQPTSQWFEIHDLRVPNLQEKILLPSYKRMRR